MPHQPASRFLQQINIALVLSLHAADSFICLPFRIGLIKHTSSSNRCIIITSNCVTSNGWLSTDMPRRRFREPQRPMLGLDSTSVNTNNPIALRLDTISIIKCLRRSNLVYLQGCPPVLVGFVEPRPPNIITVNCFLELLRDFDRKGVCWVSCCLSTN